MRLLLSLVLLTSLAGCAATTPDQDASTTLAAHANAHTGAPTHEEGTLFLPPSKDQARARSEIAFPVNATGAAITVRAHLGSRYAVELPTTTAEVTVEIVDAANVTLAKALLHAGATDATLAAHANATGMHKLVLLSYGGSDGSSMGDHLDYVIDAAKVS